LTKKFSQRLTNHLMTLELITPFELSGMIFTLCAMLSGRANLFMDDLNLFLQASRYRFRRSKVKDEDLTPILSFLGNCSITLSACFGPPP
jgi:hypothetical protein